LVLHLSAAGQSLYLVQLVHQDIQDQGSVDIQAIVDQGSVDIRAIVDQASAVIQDIQDQGSVDIRAIADQGFQVSAVIQDILELDRLGLAALHLHGSFQDKGSKC